MDKEAVREELNKVRAEIRQLKGSFSEKKKEKESHFQKGEGFSTEIDALYEEVKSIEKEHNLDKINEELEQKKKEYQEFKLALDELNSKFESVKKGSNKGSRPEIKTVSVAKAQKEIKQLETKLQTQVLSLDKESELIKKIEEMKSFVDQQTGKSTDSSEFKDVKKDLSNVRKKFINAERRIRSLYKQIRLISKEKKKKYKLIDDLRASKKKAFDEFKSHKKVYGEVSKDLKSLFKKEEELLSELGESMVQKKKQHDKNIKVKQKEAEDKLMKKGGTLTTEDLLMFQTGNKK